MLSTEDYKKIAKKEKLTKLQTDKYIKFMKKRFPNEGSEDYAREWAHRFKVNPAAYMDHISLAIFRGLTG